MFNPVDDRREESPEYAQILVVDDDEGVQAVIRTCLERSGYRVSSARDGEEALSMANSRAFDLVILDVLLPKVDGLLVCTELRKTQTLPVLMLSGLNEDVDKILGLEVGADDYLTKPFSPKELLARVRALLRRAYRFTKEEDSSEPLRVGPFSIDRAAFKISLSDEVLPLTTLEFRIFECLLRNGKNVLSRGRLVELVWGHEAPADERVVDSHIRNIRRKLPVHSQYIESVRGVGYRIQVH